MSPVSIRVTSLESRRRLEPLAFRYGWPIVVGAAPIERGFVMEFEQDRLQLRDLEQPKLKPVSVDFLSGPMRHRRHHGLSKTQVFAKAIGVTPRVSRTVVDATAG
ncbi:MAG: class I SAM-dependent methyltransferase, partial [Bdellovibrionaceae bacterium]|nr:class I SAM-dependent methyltransferase [Pseudobdellovibrionaceae bacterium]